MEKVVEAVVPTALLRKAFKRVLLWKSGRITLYRLYL
jgi:hypothetical protein